MLPARRSLACASPFLAATRCCASSAGRRFPLSSRDDEPAPLDGGGFAFGERAASRAARGGAAARRSGPTSAPAAPEPSPPRRRVIEDTPDQDEPQMPARIKHKRARDQGKDDVRGRLAF